MRRILVVLVCLAIMFVLQSLPTGATDVGLHPLTLAAIGFVVMAAFSVGEMGARLGLPKVTGYIVAGVVLGPQVANILSLEVVENMKVFNTLALGLIATTAGLELDLKAIGRVWKSLTAMVVVKIPLLLLMVGGVFVGMETFFPSLGIDELAIVPIALIVAILGIGTSPAIALAVVNDSGAKGRLTDLLLAIAVVKDLVVVVSLAIGLALAKTMLQPDAHLDAHVIQHVAEELGRSILVGAVLGGLLIAYVRFVHKQMLLFVLLTILVVAEISASWHLELLLVFIVAGFLVRNLTTYEHELLPPLERIALPVFVVFFTTAGANVDLLGTWAILPLALALFAARVIAYYIAARIGSAIGKETAEVRDNAWLTFIPQAGVTLGLVLLAAEKLPELSEPIQSIGLALVAINLLIGPITLGMGLKRAGEVGVVLADEDSEDGEVPLRREPTEDTADLSPIAPIPRPGELVAPLDGEVRDLLRDLADELSAEVRAFFRDEAGPAVHSVRDIALSRMPMDGEVQSLVDAALQPNAMPHVGWDQRVRELYRQLAVRIQLLPERVALPARPTAPDAHHLREANDPFTRRMGRKLRRLSMMRDRRRPALRMIARVRVEGRLAEGLHELVDSWYRNQSHLLELLLRTIERNEAGRVCRQRVQQATEVWLRREEERLLRVVAEGVAGVVSELIEHSSPLGDPRAPQYSTIEPAIEEHLRRIIDDVPMWRDAVAATSEHVQAASLVAVGDARTRQMLGRWGETALDEVEARTLPRIRDAVARLEDVRRRLVDPDSAAPEDGWEAEIKRAFPVARRLALRADGATFRQATQPQALQNVMAPLVDAAPERLRVVGGRRASRLDRPADLMTAEIRMKQRLRAILLDELVPEAGRAIAPLKSRLTALHRTVAEGVEVASFGVAAALRSEEEPNDLVGPVDRAISRLNGILDELLLALEQARERLRGEEDDTRRALDALMDVRGSRAQLVQSHMAVTRRSLRSTFDEVGRVVARASERVRQVRRDLLEHPWIIDRAVRLGHHSIDSEGMREAIRRTEPHPELSAEVVNLFACRAVDDRRLFVANRDALARLSDYLAHPDQHAPLAALVVGRRGSGRTSLLNMLQLRAKERHVVRVDDAAHDRSAGLISVLAAELSCSPDGASVLEALTRHRTIVLIDNLCHLLHPTFESTRSVDALLGLMAASAARGTEWVVTLEVSLADRLEDVLPLSRVFNQRVDLGGSDWRELRAVMQARLRLGGVTCEHEQPSRLGMMLPGEPADRYFKLLALKSGGNLSAAMQMHRAAMRPLGDDSLTVKRPRAVTLPFLGDLAPLARAALVVLYGYGAMNRADLAHSLGVDERVMDRHLQSLRAAGLVVQRGNRREMMTIEPGLVDSVRAELVRHRQLSHLGGR